MNKAILRTEVLSVSAIIEPDGFTSIRFINTGNDDLRIIDNIPVAATKEFFIENRPGTVIDMPINVIFAGVGNNPLVVVVRYYFQEV